jgi:hypothetical protein
VVRRYFLAPDWLLFFGACAEPFALSGQYTGGEPIEHFVLGSDLYPVLGIVQF